MHAYPAVDNYRRNVFVMNPTQKNDVGLTTETVLQVVTPKVLSQAIGNVGAVEFPLRLGHPLIQKGGLMRCPHCRLEKYQAGDATTTMTLRGNR